MSSYIAVRLDFSHLFDYMIRFPLSAPLGTWKFIPGSRKNFGLNALNWCSISCAMYPSFQLG